MTSLLTELMQKYYLSDHGTVNVRMVLEELRKEGHKPSQLFADLALVDDPTQRRWQLYAVEGLRTLAAEGQCSVDEARTLLLATNNLASVLCTDEFIKTINSLVASQKSTSILIEFIGDHLEKPTEEDRWLAFYAAGMLIENRKKEFIPIGISEALREAANAEPENKRRQEYLDLVDRIKVKPGIISHRMRTLDRHSNIFKRYDLDYEKAGSAQAVSTDPALQKIAQFVVDGDADGIFGPIRDVLKSIFSPGSHQCAHRRHARGEPPVG